MIAEHVQQRPHANRDPEEIRPLRKSRTHQETSIRTSANGDLFRSRITLCDKPFGGGNEIVKCILTIVALSGLVPFFPELPSPAHVRERKEKSVLYQERGIGIELRSAADAESSISTEECRARTRQTLPLPCNQEHRNFGVIP